MKLDLGTYWELWETQFLPLSYQIPQQSLFNWKQNKHAYWIADKGAVWVRAKDKGGCFALTSSETGHQLPWTRWSARSSPSGPPWSFWLWPLNSPLIYIMDQLQNQQAEKALEKKGNILEFCIESCFFFFLKSQPTTLLTFVPVKAIKWGERSQQSLWSK